MPDVASWGWYVTTPWPGYSIFNNDNLDTIGNGLVIDTSQYVDVILRDANGDGIIYDDDSFDGSRTDSGEAIIGPTMTLIPEEVALYTNSTLTIYGVTYTDISLQVTLFDDGSYSVRIMDSDIPAGHYSDVTYLQLGTWDGVEYSGVALAAVDDPFVCFDASTQIRTRKGDIRVDRLVSGDEVMTLDHGYQKLVWVGHSRPRGTDANAPVVFHDPHTGDEYLSVSQQHRMLVAGPKVHELCGQHQALIAAKHLVNNDTIRIKPRSRVHFVHILCNAHEPVLANGVWSETLYLGPRSLSVLSDSARSDFSRKCPEFFERAFDEAQRTPTARPFLTGRKAKEAGARQAFELIHESQGKVPRGVTPHGLIMI